MGARWRPPLPGRAGSGESKELQSRLDALPDWIRPAFTDFRDFVHDRAKQYSEERGRPHPWNLRPWLAGFMQVMGTPLELAQWGAVAAGYYVPMPDRLNRMTAGVTSAAASVAGEGTMWGSALTATAGGLTIATMAETLDVYAVASARTRAYQWAQRSPGPRVVRDEVVRFLTAEGTSFADGTLRKYGLEELAELARLAAEGVIGDLAVPLYGAARGGLRTRRAWILARNEPLSPEANEPPHADANATDRPAPSSFYDWFAGEVPTALFQPKVLLPPLSG